MQNELITFVCPISGKRQAINPYVDVFCDSDTYWYCHEYCPFVDLI